MCGKTGTNARVQVAFSNELLRRESTARTIGLRALLDFIYDHFGERCAS